jgi:hypothetical protein
MHDCKRSFTLEILMPYVERILEPVIRRAVQEFPVVVLTGPRQSGKTTLLRHLFVAGYRYASLDTLDVRAAASDDLRGFLALYPSPDRNMARGIATFRRDMGARVVKGYVVYPGDVTLPLGPDAVAWPFAAL